MMPITLHRRPSRRQRRKSAVFGSCITILVILVVYYSHGWSTQASSGTTTPPPTVPTSPMLEDQARFWRSLYHIILNNDPKCQALPDVVVPEKLDIAYEDDHVHNRPDILWIENSDLQRLKEAHQNFLNDMQSSRLRPVYQAGTRGIITTVSDSQIPLLLIQLRMLRSADSILPLEVFLSQPSPYSVHVCLNILPAFNATCVYFSSIFTVAGTGVSVTTYQYKILAILFSSFDEILLLDSDAWPISNPDHLFTYPPFVDTGLIIWPDFWYASESPYYFAIAKIDDPPMLHTKPASESGEIMYSKSKHEASIMLATYYNYHGPEYYYPLQSQGAPGQGDKETFGCAALAMKEDFYWVKTMVTAIGRMDSSGRWLGSAMVQYDPIVDFQQRDMLPQQGLTALRDHDGKLQNQEMGQPPKLSIPPKRKNKPMFMHANVPKFDPRSVFNDHNMGSGIYTSPARDTNGTYVRCWDMTADAAIERFGYDVERRFWEVIKTVACVDLIGQGDMSRKANEIQTCQRVEEYVQQVFGRSGNAV